MKKSKMAQLFSLYAENPNLTNEEGLEDDTSNKPVYLR